MHVLARCLFKCNLPICIIINFIKKVDKGLYIFVIDDSPLCIGKLIVFVPFFFIKYQHF